MKPSLKPVSEQVVVITGASSGIGRESALRFARKGARVVLAAREAEALHELEREIQAEGGQALAVPADVTDFAQVERLASRTVERFGRIDTWVNDAAVSAYATFEQLTLDEFRQIIETDFFGTVYGCRAALPHLKREGRGALICVGSALSDRSVPLQSAYCAAKHAVKGFVEALRVELAHEGSAVQVTLVKPSSMNTPFFENALTKTGHKPKPISPVYAPGLVADVIVHCAEHREREMVVGGGGKLMTAMESFAGPLLDWYQNKTAFQGQQTKEPESASAPNNLRHPVAGTARREGDFGGRRFSLYTWMRLHPRQTLGGAAALGGLALVGALRPARSGHR